MEATVSRALRIIPPERLLVLTSAGLADPIREALRRLPRASVVAEPVSRDTLAAAVLGTAEVCRRTGRDDVPVLVVPCDQAVWGLDAWRRGAAALLAWAAHTSSLVALGLRPERPEPGYGYLRPGPALRPAGASAPRGPAVRRVEAFVEKPGPAQAGRLVAAGWLWNSGTFGWRGDVWFDQVSRFVPGGGAAVAAARRGDLDSAYRMLPRQSIDRAVFERGAPALVAEGGFRWEDLGSWSAVWRVGPPDRSGNVTRGPAVVLGGSGNLAWSSGPRVVLSGVEGLLVVADGEVVLVAGRQDDRRIREVTGYLRQTDWRQYL